MLKSAFLTVLIAIGLTGCAHGPDGTVGTAGAAVVTGDKFTKTWTIVGDRVTNGVHLIDGQFGWMIRTFVDKTTGVRSHQLYVDVTYSGGWRFYEAASDETATDLQVTEIDREVGDCSNTLFGCDFSEVVGVELPEPALRAHASTGYQIQLRAKSGNSQVLVVTKEQIQQQFAKLDQLTAGLPAGGGSGAEGVVPSGKKLGVKVVPTPAVMSALLGVPAHQGAWVLSVDAGSRAQAAGITQGDVITSINGGPVNDYDGLVAAVRGAPIGKEMSVALVHAGKAETLSIPN